jgi:predicted secreted protein
MDAMAEPEEFKVEGTAGLPIALPISTGPATGYGWEFDLPNGVERTKDAPGRDVPDDAGLGGAQGGQIQVTAVPGEHVIMARLVRPWNRDMPIRTVRIHLTVSSK